MGSELAQLWRGELQLARALIGYALIYGLAINLLMSGVALAAYMAARGRPGSSAVGEETVPPPR